MVVEYSHKNHFETIGLLAWTLLPCLAVWLGMYQIKSAVWTFALYHGVCLLPAIVWGKSYWSSSLSGPSLKAILILVLGSIFFSCVALLTYEYLGKKLLSDMHILELLKEQRFSSALLWPLSIYAIVVNPVLEEMFWRGVVLNKLDSSKFRLKNLGLIWSSISYAAFHYLIFRLVLFPFWAELGTVLLAFYGAGLAFIYRKTGSILTTAITHGLLTDLAAVVLILDLLRRHPGVLY